MELFLLASIAGRPVAIASDQVESAVDLGDVIEVPLAPKQVRGLAALRSRVVTVIDSLCALGIDGERAPARAVVTKVDDHFYAIMVDSLDDVMPFERGPLASGVSLDRNWERIARGVVDHGGEPVLVIDVKALIPELAMAE